MTTIVVTQQGNVLVPVVRTNSLTSVAVGPQGPQGPAGGATAPVYATALTNLTYPCVVAVDNGVAHYADPTNYADMTSQLAITASAALAGGQVTIITTGVVTQSGWNWSPGRVYLALKGGALTQSPDPSASVLEVGRVLNPTTIEFGIAPAILR